jgi:hypothetical protein
MTHTHSGRTATTGTRVSYLLAIVTATGMLQFASFSALAAPLDAKAISRAAGTKATAMDDGVLRIGWSRNDVPVTVDGTSFPAAAGLGSWAAFAPARDHAMVMGDTVVFEDEVDAAMGAAFAHGLEVTALHNHFFYDTPKVYFMHIGGAGDSRKLASGVRAVWDAIKSVRSKREQPATGFGGAAITRGSIDAQALGRIIGHPVPVSDGVPKVTIGREGSMHDVPVGASMGLTTWAAFTGSDTLAAMDGDFIMTAEEVQPVLRALRKEGLHVVALHQHMVGEQPTFYFMHFWGKGPAADLAHSFRAALDAQDAVPRLYSGIKMQ